MRAAGAQSVPRRVIATFDDYASAERAVDTLSDRGFAVERTAIVGRDLELVEQVTGRLTTARAALNGALGGGITGLFIGWIFGLFNWWNPVIASGWLALWGLLFGAVIGALFGMIGHMVLGGRRDFASVGAMRAHHYDVVVDEDVAEEAMRVLNRIPVK
ncbi:MAG: hypothetical protein QOE86_3055 [Solirubrobacteraceae bacterium]|jgi:uncharacterized membrane protein|nr:hypothetical protein [Solirubrobacteraceae bacterium]